jgi:hypothetical protein
MKWDAWLFSARQAWQRPLFKWTTVAIALLFFLSSGFFSWKILSQRSRGDTLVLHYNIYLGIDQLGSWKWIVLLPAVWFIVTLIDLVMAYGFYHRDVHFAASLLCLACVWGLPWATALFYLTLVNV